MRWICFDKKTDDIVKQILINRKIKDFDRFLNPDFYKDMHDPKDLNDIKKATQIIINAKKNNEKIGIFADYDADGVPGAALLAKILEKLKIDYEFYIPSRNEGYGLNEKGIKKLYNQKVKILITIDLGITGKKEVILAKKLGMKVIITDHHEIIENLYPKSADAIVHTHISKRYKNKDLAGGAVVYKILQYLVKQYKLINLNEQKWLLDLPAISTICDMVPLIGENRVIAKYGLMVLAKTKNIGLKKMYEIIQIDPNNISTYHIGFLIGPRINAPGRMTNANSSFLLLTTNDSKKAKDIANKLNQINLIRQQKLEETINKAIKEIKNKNLNKNKIILIKGKNWPIGIIGLVASRITEKYSRPSIVFSEIDGVLKGSARSIDEFEIISNIAKLKKILISFGGHAKAAGIAIKKENWNEFCKKMQEIADKEILDIYLQKKIKIDYILEPKDVNLNLIKNIKKIEPYGIGNPRPIFQMNNLSVLEVRKIGKKLSHLKIKLKKENSNKIFDAVYFNCLDNIDKIKKNQILDLVFYLEENIWNGKTYIQFNILDFKIN